MRKKDLSTSNLDAALYRQAIRRLLSHIERDAAAGDGIGDEAWDDYHAARMLVGRTDGNWDSEAAGRAWNRIRRSALGPSS